MSRTLHHGDKAKQRKFEGRKGEKLKRSVAGWHWMSTPGWWVREMMTAPQRRQTRDMLKKAERDPDAEQDWPHPTKPEQYYW
jgi:hypothetical protein